jgi:hypothetical protein
MRKPKLQNAFELGQTVYLLGDRSEWIVTHLVISVTLAVTYRISNGYTWCEVYEIEITDDPNAAKKIKGFLE